MNGAAAAAAQIAVTEACADGWLAENLRALPPGALAEHFRTRGEDHYFAIADPDETQTGKIDAILGGRFEFNHETHVLPPRFDWLRNPSADVEWHILLHKFYYAVGLGLRYRETGSHRYLDAWVDLASTWMDQTPPGFIAADVTGRRVQNWIYAFHHFAGAIGTGVFTPAFLRRFLASLATQVEYLCANLTPKRNHRTLELYAIFLAGVAFPEFEAAAAWRAFALAGLVENIRCDLLPDGVHCELSTDYHHLVLKNYLCVRRLAGMNGIAVPAVMDERLVRALEFSLHVHKPDGIVPSLSDGDARSFRDLLLQGAEIFGREDMRYVATLGAEGTPPRKRAQGFGDGGYYVLRSGWGQGRLAYTDEHFLVFDCGPLGEGNHGHLDCLSFELAAHGRSVVVDPGRFTYSEAGDVNWRVRFRGTASHNTVTVDGRNQTRYEPKAVKPGTRHAPGSVRHRIAGPAPEAALTRFVVEEGFGLLHGVARSHEYPVVHDRRIAFVFGEYWVVLDTLVSETSHRYDQWFHLTEHAQDATHVRRHRGTVSVASPGLLVAHEDRDDVDAGVEPGRVSYRYGEAFDAPVVRITQTARTGRFATVLFPHRGPDAPRITVRELTVDGARDARALRIDVGEGLDACSDLLVVAGGPPAACTFGGYAFDGTWLALRRDAGGEIVALHADRGATLADRRGPLLWRGLAS